MSYQLYRNTTLGHTLQESLDEFIQVNDYIMQAHLFLCHLVLLNLTIIFFFSKAKLVLN